MAAPPDAARSEQPTWEVLQLPHFFCLFLHSDERSKARLARSRNWSKALLPHFTRASFPCECDFVVQCIWYRIERRKVEWLLSFLKPIYSISAFFALFSRRSTIHPPIPRQLCAIVCNSAIVTLRRLILYSHLWAAVNHDGFSFSFATFSVFLKDKGRGA